MALAAAVALPEAEVTPVRRDAAWVPWTAGEGSTKLDAVAVEASDAVGRSLGEGEPLAASVGEEDIAEMVLS